MFQDEVFRMVSADMPIRFAYYSNRLMRNYLSEDDECTFFERKVKRVFKNSLVYKGHCYYSMGARSNIMKTRDVDLLFFNFSIDIDSHAIISRRKRLEGLATEIFKLLFQCLKPEGLFFTIIDYPYGDFIERIIRYAMPLATFRSDYIYTDYKSKKVRKCLYRYKAEDTMQEIIEKYAKIRNHHDIFKMETEVSNPRSFTQLQRSNVRLSPKAMQCRCRDWLTIGALGL